ncbi:MAG: hypothetical protein BRD50_08250 [Bacteroidetes bacterium SW_11_45_7]|nr:MAG: hypothetical protein BRD50_08250 [Bacteroidetes bacterium SW_11_45_7]
MDKDMRSEQTYTESELIEGIRTDSENVYRYLYRTLSPLIYKDIVNHSGSQHEAEDHFHDVMLVVSQNVKRGKYEQGNIIGYCRMVARNLWHKKLRKKNVEVRSNEFDNIDPADEANYEKYKALVKYDRDIQLIQNKLKAMGDTCRQILMDFYYTKIGLQEIADKFAWSYQYCKKKVYQCRQNLRESIEQDPSFEGYIR